MNTLRTNFETLRKAHIHCFEALERAFNKFDIDFYLIGARARDIWLDHLNIKEKRTTTDIDLCIYIQAYEEFRELCTYLCTVEEFQKAQDEPYRFFYGEFMVDLLPFGEIEQDGYVWLENPPTQLSAYGMREVTEQAEIVSGEWKVVSLPGLMILKLIAFSENPGREKDIRDVELILQYYHEIAGELLWNEEHKDLREESDDIMITAARILGRQIGIILSGKLDLLRIARTSLNSRLRGLHGNEINELYKYRERNPNYRDIILMKLFLECEQGIQDSQT